MGGGKKLSTKGRVLRPCAVLPLPPPGPFGCLLLHPRGRPCLWQVMPRLSERWTAPACDRMPRGDQREPQEEKRPPCRVCPRRAGDPRREGSQGGAGAPGRGLRHRILGFPRPSRRLLPTRRGYCKRSARNNPPPSCCIANKILMSPLPLPLGRRGRSARGAGGSAGCASAPCPRGLPAALATGPAPYSSSLDCRRSLSLIPTRAWGRKKD